MKGLLYKDLISYRKEIISVFAVSFVFLIVNFFLSVYASSSHFLRSFPILYSGVAIVTLAYSDEVARFSVFSQSLPYSRAVQVSEKYILILLMIGVTALAERLCNIAVSMYTHLAINMHRNIYENISFSGFAAFNTYSIAPLLIRFTMALICPAVGLPIIFKKGEKGKSGYVVTVCLFSAFCAGSGIAERLIFECMRHPILMIFILLAGVLIFAASWVLSVYLFKHRDF